MSLVPSQIRNSTASTRGGWRWGRFLPALMFALAFLLLPAGSSLFSASESTATVPLTTITGVVRDDSVSIHTQNFPANTDFTVTMGPMGTRGINGYVVGTVNSGASGSFDASFEIPSELYGSYQISIRLQSGGYYPYFSYNWFYNNTTGTTPPPVVEPPVEPPDTPGYSGIPTFKIVAVKRNESVTIQTNNFPANQTFKVTMGPMGTRGINGVNVGTLESGAGGALTETYTIPPELYDHTQIAIRAQTAHAYPYYAYNWFWNNDANVAMADAGTGGTPSDSTDEPESEPPAAADPVYYGIPVISITGVVRDQEVTFQTHNYPANVDFSVKMGPMGTRGVNGIHVGDFNSGSGGSFPVTMPIPAELAGSYQIAINAQSHHPMPYAYYSYNWFYNNTTP
jgi:hypothetical protein